jgi:hypothetical protein
MQDYFLFSHQANNLKNYPIDDPPKLIGEKCEAIKDGKTTTSGQAPTSPLQGKFMM